MRHCLFLLAGLAASLSACATDVAQRDAKRAALYRAHTGAPVKHFRYFGSLNSWTPLDEHSVAVWTRPNEAYLLDFTGPCPEIRFTHAIGLTNTFGQVSVPFDKVIVHDRGVATPPCHIAQIRPLDTKALKAARRAVDTKGQASGDSGT